MRRVAAAVVATAAVWSALARDEREVERTGVARPVQPPTSGFAGLWHMAQRIYEATERHSVMLVAAGVTFYGLLAIFPALTVLVSVYGLFADPATITSQVQSLSTLLPGGAITVIGDQMQRITAQSGGRLGLAAAAGLVIALWSANSGMKAIFEGLNIAYDTEDRRGFLKLTLRSLLFTIGAIVGLILAIGAIVVVPVLLGYVGLGGVAETLVKYGRWLLLLAIVIVGISLLYRYGPDRRPPSWNWVSPGAVVAAIVWVVASALFSWFVANFGSYNATYGSLGAAVGFMVWMWITATIVLVGAELDAELERRRRRSPVSARRPEQAAR